MREPDIARPRRVLRTVTPEELELDDPADQPPPSMPAPGRERLYGRFDVPPTGRTIANVQRQSRVIE